MGNKHSIRTEWKMKEHNLLQRYRLEPALIILTVSGKPTYFVFSIVCEGYMNSHHATQ
jgi:hypothetical protein